MNGNKVFMRLFLALIAVFMFWQTVSFAEDYYTAGMNALQRKEYVNAIDYFQKALIQEPNNTSILNNLAVAYTSRGTEAYNKGTDLESAANDYRNAIYYLEFYNKSANTPTMNQNVPIAHQNLTSVLERQKFKLDAPNRLRKAKELRGKGEFTAAIVEYSYAAKDRKYSYESYVAMGDVMKNLSSEYNAAIYYDKALAQDASDPYLHLKFGRTLYKLGNIDTAVRELDIAMENPNTKDEATQLLENIWKERATKRPNDPVAQMNLGVVYQNKGQYDLAMEQYRKAKAIDPKNQMIRLNMATLLQQQKKYSEALSIYNDILKIRPNDVTVATYKATTLYKMGHTDAAIVMYENLLVANPNNTEIKNDLLNVIGETTEESALAHLQTLSEKFPSDADIVYNYAYALHKAKKYEDALVEYKKVISADNKRLDAYLNLASIYRQKNDTAKAIEVLNSAKLVFPDEEKITQGLAEFEDEKNFQLAEKAANLYNNKDYNGAIAVYQGISNPSEDVYLGIGACYQAMEKYDDAINYYNKAIAKDASSPNAYYFLGLAYLYKKDYPKAEIALKKAKELDDLNPDIEDAYKSLKFAQSEQLMNTAIKQFENNKNDDALNNFNKSIAICAENGYAYYYRGLVYDTKGKNALAIADYKKAIELNPELTMAYYSIALSYDALDNKAEAKKMYQKFLQENETTNDEYTQYAKQRLSEL
ncbi:MAG: tetratricopeptide repeat protein [bacterium]|nr:tetratricopeptide repeat protein [bacterium]